MHTFFQELKFYSKLVSKNSYCIVQNTKGLIKMLSKNTNHVLELKANNPYTFDKKFLNKEKIFIIDKKNHN